MSSEQRYQECKDFLKEAYFAEGANVTICSSVGIHWAGRLRIVRQIEAIVPKSCSAMGIISIRQADKLAKADKNTAFRIARLLAEEKIVSIRRI